jgi:hypothetical protein
MFLFPAIQAVSFQAATGNAEAKKCSISIIAGSPAITTGSENSLRASNSYTDFHQMFLFC